MTPGLPECIFSSGRQDVFYSTTHPECFLRVVHLPQHVRGAHRESLGRPRAKERHRAEARVQGHVRIYVSQPEAELRKKEQHMTLLCQPS